MAKRFHQLRVAILAAFGLGCIEEPRARSDEPESADSGGRPDANRPDSQVLDARVPDPHSEAGRACENPEPQFFRGQPTGTVLCDDGATDLVGEDCRPELDDAEQCRFTAPGSRCETAADCNARAHGRCKSGDIDCYCTYGCATDADCGPRQVCVCANERTRETRCVAVNDCRNGLDCETGRCGLTYDDGACEPTPLLGCRSTEDTCATNADCSWENFTPYCEPSFNPEQPGWHCIEEGAVCGRPLRVDGQQRLAEHSQRIDWSARIDLADLDPTERAGRAEWWGEIAALEHASVASFARFSLQLMALGAPPELLAEAHQAGADEVEHARLAYGVASAYAKRPLGPAPLVLTDLQIETDPATVVREVVREACVGETLGAAEAQAASESETDPALRAVWMRIAADEQRHAVLGWKTLRWLLAENGALVGVARDAFECACADFCGVSEYDVVPGRPNPNAVRALRATAIAEVIRPCAAAVLG